MSRSARFYSFIKLDRASRTYAEMASQNAYLVTYWIPMKAPMIARATNASEMQNGRRVCGPEKLQHDE